MSATSKHICKVVVRKVHDEKLSTHIGNTYNISLNNDYTGFIVFKATNTDADIFSIPYEIIYKVAFKNKYIKLVLDANNAKGPGIELEFFEESNFERFKGQIVHYVALCRENNMREKSRRDIVVHQNASSSSSMQTGHADAPIDVDANNNNSDGPLSFDKQKAYLLLQNNPEMMSLYKQLVPPLEPHEFWDNQSRKNQVAIGLQAGETLRVGKTSEGNIKTDRRGNKNIDLNENHLRNLLRTRPVVEAAYRKYVLEKKIIDHTDFFVTLALNDQYRQGEIDESQINTNGTNQQIFIDIEAEEKQLHLINRETRLVTADPLFDLRSTHSELLRGQVGAKEGYGIIDRSLKRIENVDIESTEILPTVDERTTKKTNYSVEQFNQQGDRILSSIKTGTNRKLHTIQISENGSSDGNMPHYIHPDLVTPDFVSQHRKALPLTFANNGMSGHDNDNNLRPLKRQKTEEEDLLQEIKNKLESYKYNPKRTCGDISRPPKYDLKYITGKKDGSSGLMSQVPSFWLKESKGKGPSPNNTGCFVYLKHLQNINGSTKNYFDEHGINPIRTWSAFKLYQSRKDLFWSRTDLKEFYALSRVGKELLVFFWSHFTNKHSAAKLQQIVGKIKNNIQNIQKLTTVVEATKNAMIEPLNYAITRYIEKYEKKKSKKVKSEVIKVKSEVGNGRNQMNHDSGKRKRDS
eukprot:g1888.t1